jgi:phosphatidate cytidylyltransferase
VSARRKRVLAALVMAPLAIGAVLFLPTPVLAAVVAGLLMVGLWEWTLLSGTSGRAARAGYLAANMAIMTSLAWTAGHGLGQLVAVATWGSLWWLLALLWLWRFDFASGGEPWTRAIKLLAGTLCVVPAWAALSWLHAGDGNGNGPAWTLFALLIVWVADTGAYFTGSRWGRHKLAPRISPGKSWEGFAGGLAATALLAVIAAPVLGLPWNRLGALLLLTGVAFLFSVSGDLFESLLKRHAGAKDSSDLIPGHGGVLDRVDSLLAALPVFAVGKLWLGL